MISNLNQNIFFWDESAETFTEYTRELNDFSSGTATLTFDVDDRLFIATALPFNNRYFDLTQLNANTSANLVIEYYSGDLWKSPSRILDYTESLAGATFGKSGIVQFIPDNEFIISQQSDTDVMDQNFKDHAPSVYNMYWQGFGFDATTTIGFNYVGQLFCESDDKIYSKYPTLRPAELLEQWEPGKTDWLEQRIEASNDIVSELERRSIIVSRNQVLDTARLEDACIHYTAWMMFSGLGVDRFEKEIASAFGRYKTAMQMDKYNVDLTRDAHLGSYERQATITLRGR